MEAPAIEDNVELLTEQSEVERITHDAASRRAAHARLRSGEADRGRGNVDPDRFATCICCHQDVLSRPATNIEPADRLSPPLVRIKPDRDDGRVTQASRCVRSGGGI